MRFCIAAGSSDIAIEPLLEVCESVGAERVFLLGDVAKKAAESIRATRAESDEDFLDDVATYLLNPINTGEKPRRHAVPELFSRVIAVVEDPDPPLAPLPTTDRAVEMVGAHIFMVVPDRKQLEQEDLDNATVWVSGNTDEPVLDTMRGQPVLSPGSLDGRGGLLVVEIGRTRVQAELLRIDGQVVRSENFRLSARTRMSVQG